MRLQRLTPVALVVVVVALVALLGSFPARQIVQQRRDLSVAERRLAVVDADIERLSARLAALDQPDEVKRLARERLNLVEPGQEAYRILLPPPSPVPMPQGWPFLLPNSENPLPNSENPLPDSENPLPDSETSSG